jgi:hypothetical protein
VSFAINDVGPFRGPDRVVIFHCFYPHKKARSGRKMTAREFAGGPGQGDNHPENKLLRSLPTTAQPNSPIKIDIGTGAESFRRLPLHRHLAETGIGGAAASREGSDSGSHWYAWPSG